MSLPLTDSQRQALRSASHWYAVLSDERASPQQTEKWQQWYEQNRDHQWAWSQVENLRNQMNVVPSNVAHRALQDTQLTRRRVMKGLLLLLGVGGGWQLWRSDTGTGLRADYTTAKGAIRQQRLEDGTLLSLNTDSAVDVRFDPQQRRIHLWYGEIAITTGQDASSRPFYVQTRHGQLTALGTEFMVRQEADSTVLSVQHHAVKVVLVEDPTQERIVRQGESLRFSARELGEIQSAEEEDSNWAQGILSFSNKPLGDVIATLSRYRHGVLRCSPEVATLRLSGTFPLKNTDTVLQVIEKTLPVKIQYITRYWVNILPAN